jgi:RNA polymerase sigma-70 factor (ECF subfamily)
MGPTHPDSKLAKRLRDGDEAAFREFFDASFPKLYRFALARLRGRSDEATDVVQQTLCKAFEHLDSYRGEASLFGWMCQICRNAINDRRRHAQHEAIPVGWLEDEADLHGILEAIAAPGEDEPEHDAARRDLVRLVQTALDGLPGRYGDVLEWKYVDGLSVKEIARRLAVGPKAAESLLTRARCMPRAARGDRWRAGLDSCAGRDTAMTDRDHTWRSAQPPPDEDALGRLIRAAGRRPSPTAAEYERVRLAAHIAWQTKVDGRRRRFVSWALAASVAIVVVIAAATVPWAPSLAVAKLTVALGAVERFAPDRGRWETLASGAEILAGSRLRTSPDGGAAFVVANGVIVRARSASEWIFDGAVKVTLAGGTLYVDTGSATGAARELETVTPHGIVRHVGTQYEVRALSSEMRVRVREGRVQVRARAAGQSHEAPAGQELLFTADGTALQRPFATDSPEWQWAQALAAPIELDGRSAFDALQWVARETGKRLIFDDPNAELIARQAIIHGDGAGLEPLQVLEIVMTTSTGLDYVLGDGTLVVRRR